MRSVCLKAVVFCFCLVGGSFLCAQEPGWYGRVILPESQRKIIEATPIINRPYRPLHFYGNTVRRRYYHGRALPSLRGRRAQAQVKR